MSWLPDRKISVSGSFLGSLRDGVQARAELATHGLPVLGRSQRRLEADLTPGTPAAVTLTYAWTNEGEEEEHNVTCEMTVKKSASKLVVDLKAASTLWDDKEAKVRERTIL